MENITNEIRGFFPDLLRNIQFHFSIEGWPASITLITISISAVAIYGINNYTKIVSSNRGSGDFFEK